MDQNNEDKGAGKDNDEEKEKKVRKEALKRIPKRPKDENKVKADHPMAQDYYAAGKEVRDNAQHGKEGNSRAPVAPLRESEKKYHKREPYCYGFANDGHCPDRQKCKFHHYTKDQARDW